MHDRIKTVLADVLRLPVAVIPDDASVETLPAWDSLAHLEIMLALETQLGVRFPAEAMARLTSIGAIEEYLLPLGV